MTQNELLLPATTHLVLHYEKDWLTIWLNRPESRNALSAEMLRDLSSVLAAIRPNRNVRGITLRGKGGFFCAGGDLKSINKVQNGTQGHADIARLNKQSGHVLRVLSKMPQFVFIFVEGGAIAGGLGMVCCGDVSVATQDARFSLTETQRGIIPAQIAPLVVNRLGLPAARRLVMTGTRFEGEEALRIGLVDKVSGDVVELEAFEIAIRASVMRCAPQANATIKQLLLDIPNMPEEQIADRAAHDFANCMLRDEAREGIAAFIEKRNPNWVK